MFSKLFLLNRWELWASLGNHINGHHAWWTMVIAPICACIDIRRTYVNAPTNPILALAKQVRYSKRLFWKSKTIHHVPIKFSISMLQLINFLWFLGETQVTSRPTNPIDYFETDIDDDGESGFSNDNSSIARIVITATAVLGVLLIIVLCAILCKSFHIYFWDGRVFCNRSYDDNVSSSWNVHEQIFYTCIEIRWVLWYSMALVPVIFKHQ